jgi:protein-disulfide isomerase
MGKKLGIRAVLDVVAAVAMISVSIALMWSMQTRASSTRTERRAALPSAPVALTNMQQVGSVSAPVVAIIYSDFECPFCARFATGTWPQIKLDYIDKGRLRVAFSQYPLDELHISARRAAEVSECAADQGKFWPVHDLLFSKQRELRELLTEPRLSNELGPLGLESERLTSCLSSGVAKRVDEMSKAAGPLGVSGTPTFFVGIPSGSAAVLVKERLEGAVSAATFGTTIDKLDKGSAAVK